MGSHQAALEEDVTLLNGQTSSSLTGQTSGLSLGQLTHDRMIVLVMEAAVSGYRKRKGVRSVRVLVCLHTIEQ